MASAARPVDRAPWQPGYFVLDTGPASELPGIVIVKTLPQNHTWREVVRVCDGALSRIHQLPDRR